MVEGSKFKFIVDVDSTTILFEGNWEDDVKTVLLLVTEGLVCGLLVGNG